MALFDTGDLAQQAPQLLQAVFLWLRHFFASTWWFWSFFFLFSSARSAFLYWRQRIFESSMTWSFLEFKIPREILKSPRSMDQLLQGLAALRNVPSNFGEKYLDGEVTRWFTFEMVSFGGEIHFYARVYKKLRHMVEAVFFSYYPDVEIIESPDYISKLPHSVADAEAQNLELWGSEVVLKKEAGFPIRTYLAFESPDEEHQFDPMSAFMENLGKLKKEEFLGVQFNIAPEDQDWGKHFEHIVEDLRTPKEAKNQSHAKTGDPTADAIKKAMLQKSPGETDVLRTVEENLSKPAFKCFIRVLYLSPRHLFFDTMPRRAVLGSLNQYGSAALNSFLINKDMTSKTDAWSWPYVFRGFRNRARQQRILHTYLEREFEIEEWMGKFLTSHFFNWNCHSRELVLSTESLASIYHPPTSLVLTAPHTQRIESKKMGAPAGLPIYADESVLDRFK